MVGYKGRVVVLGKGKIAGSQNMKGIISCYKL